jgi:transposase
MANKTIRMSVLRNIISLKSKGYSNRFISDQLGLSRKTTNKYISHLKQSGLSHQALLDLSDEELATLVDAIPTRPSPGYLQELYNYFPTVEKELKRVGVTRYILWQEYKQVHPEGISYARFCAHFRQWQQSQEVTMHFAHKAGDKLFVDFTGKKLEIVDSQSGEVTPVEVFVAILGASQYTYVEAVSNQKTESFIGAVGRAFSFFGGVPQAVVPDNRAATV